MKMINNVVLVGRLTKDIELKYTAGGIAYASYTVAVNRPFSNKNGDNEADFVNCISWRATAENMAKYVGKGSLIGVEGRIETSSFEGNDGQRVFMTRVVTNRVQFLESKNSRQQNNNQPNFGGQPSNQPKFNAQQQNNFNNYQKAYQENNPQEVADPFSSTPDVNDSDLPF